MAFLAYSRERRLGLLPAPFRGPPPCPGSFLPVSGRRRMHAPPRVSPPVGRRRLGPSEVSGRRAAVPTAGLAPSPSPRFPRCPLRTPFPAPFEVQPFSRRASRGRKRALRGSRGPHRGIRSGGSPPAGGFDAGFFCGLPAGRPPFGSQRPAGPFSAPGRCGKRPCGLKACTGASRGRPGPSPGRSLLPLRLGLSPEPAPPSLFLPLVYKLAEARGERERET